jgi:hypothetical protein
LYICLYQDFITILTLSKGTGVEELGQNSMHHMHTPALFLDTLKLMEFTA